MRNCYLVGNEGERFTGISALRFSMGPTAVDIVLSAVPENKPIAGESTTVSGAKGIRYFVNLLVEIQKTGGLILIISLDIGGRVLAKLAPVNVTEVPERAQAQIQTVESSI